MEKRFLFLFYGLKNKLLKSPYTDLSQEFVISLIKNFSVSELLIKCKQLFQTHCILNAVKIITIKLVLTKEIK